MLFRNIKSVEVGSYNPIKSEQAFWTNLNYYCFERSELLSLATQPDFFRAERSLVHYHCSFACK